VLPINFQRPVYGNDGKPVLGEDGRPVLVTVNGHTVAVVTAQGLKQFRTEIKPEPEDAATRKQTRGPLTMVCSFASST
jgi:hypothetical protein